MESNQLKQVASPAAHPRAFVYRNAETIATPHPLRRHSDLRAVPARSAHASAVLQFRIYVRSE